MYRMWNVDPKGIVVRNLDGKMFVDSKSTYLLPKFDFQKSAASALVIRN